jgi:MraZ protein
VPAAFRSALTRGGADAVFLYPSPGVEALDAGGQALLEKMAGLIDGLGPFSARRDVFSTAIFGDSAMVNIDGDGRIILPEVMRNYAHIADMAVFVGLGAKFQLWEPRRFEAHQARAREEVRVHLEGFGEGTPGGGPK